MNGKRMTSVFLPGAALLVAALTVLGGCAKPPAQEMSDAKAALDALTADSAGKYIPELIRSLEKSQQAALDEVQAQDSKLFKKYDKAQAEFVKIKEEAVAAKTEMTRRKAEARQKAVQSEQDAWSAISMARDLLAKAPRGKGSAADIEAMKADVDGLEVSLVDVKNLVEKEDFGGALHLAGTIKEKAEVVSAAVNEAIDKFAMANKGRRK